jgi:pimeloyl-ACP methyl ester carboxylesterase
VTIHLIHGIHTAPSNPTVPGLVPYLQKAGFPVAAPNYGYILGIEALRMNPVIEGVLEPYIWPSDIAIGHSNGCAIIYELLKRRPLKGVVLIDPALESAIALSGYLFKWADVYFNAGDTLTEVAEVAEKMGIAPRCWGEMGHDGYLGSDPRVHNIDCGNTEGMPKVNGHSDLFTAANLPAWGDFIAKRIRERLTEGGTA